MHTNKFYEKLISTLLQRPIFKTERDLFKVLNFGCSDAPQKSDKYEYLLKVQHPDSHGMSWYVEHAGCIEINEIDADMYIDCTADKIVIKNTQIQNIPEFSLGTQKFYDSIRTIDIGYWFGWN